MSINRNYIQREIEELEPAERDEILCLIRFLLWSDRRPDPLRTFWQVLRGAWLYTCHNGIWRLWLKLTVPA